MRVNRGPRAARTPGFEIDLHSGELVRPDADSRRTAPRAAREVRRVDLFVRNTRNLLLIRPLQPGLLADRTVETTLLYALERGVEAAYQLDENELAVEIVGEGEHWAFLFYETSEGGSGVLRRLVDEPAALAQVAQEALARCHFDPDGGDQNPSCIAACYECLLSYRNQLDALYLDRRAIVELLVGLAGSRVELRVAGRSRQEHLAWLRSLVDPDSELERRFLDALEAGGYRLPVDAQRSIAEPACNVDFFYEPNVCVFCDGGVHDEPEQRRRDEALREELRNRGYEVIVVRYDRDLDDQIAAHPAVFGSP